MPTFRALARRAAEALRRALLAPERHAWLLLVLFLVALVPRLQFAVEEHPPGLYLVSDMAIYRERAVRLLDGPRDVWDTFTPPGYPALIALIFAALGRDDALVGWAQAALGAATVTLAFLLAHRVSRSAVAALGAFAVLAIYPPLVLYTGLFLTETTCAFLVTLFVVAFTAAVERERAPAAVLAGVAFAAGAAVRPNLLLALPFLAVVVMTLRRDRRITRAAAITVLAALPILACASAWSSRLANRPVALATNGGVNFYLAHAHVRAVRFPEGDPIREISTYQSRTRAAPIEVVTLHAHEDAAFYARGLAALRRDPFELVRALGAVLDGLGLGHLGGRENPPYWPGWMGHDAALGGWLRAMLALGTFPAMAHAAWLARGRALLRPDQVPRLVVLALFASVVATLYVFLGNPRVRVPFDPLLVTLAAAAYADLGRGLAARRRRRPAPRG